MIGTLSTVITCIRARELAAVMPVSNVEWQTAPVPCAGRCK